MWGNCMNKAVKYLLDETERLDYSVEQEDGNVFLISTFSPAGQDCNASIDTEDNAELFINNIRAYAEDFDVSFETYLWLDSNGHGRNGAPYDMKDVYEDMKWWQNSLEKLANILEIILSEYKFLDRRKDKMDK